MRFSQGYPPQQQQYGAPPQGYYPPQQPGYPPQQPGYPPQQPGYPPQQVNEGRHTHLPRRRHALTDGRTHVMCTNFPTRPM